MGERRFKFERLTVTEWQRERGGVGEAAQARTTPRSTQSGERLRVAWFLCGWCFGPLGVFLAVPFTFIFYGKREGLPRRNPRRRPPPTPVI